MSIKKSSKHWAIWVRFGETQHVLRDGDGLPRLFVTRQAARTFIDEHYGYIRDRKDLRTPPHNWRLPLPVKVQIEAKVVT